MNDTASCSSTARRVGLVVIAIAIGLLGDVRAQQPAPAPATQRVIGATVLHLNVVNLDESLAFYRDVLGMEKYEDGAMRAGEFLGGEPGGKLRSARVRVPGGMFAMERVEWSGVPLRPERRNFNDPAARAGGQAQGGAQPQGGQSAPGGRGGGNLFPPITNLQILARDMTQQQVLQVRHAAGTS
jgi:catechol 2,3-dioxygenase-like lactoylglutathione lyase family enzyme